MTLGKISWKKYMYTNIEVENANLFYTSMNIYTSSLEHVKFSNKRTKGNGV